MHYYKKNFIYIQYRLNFFEKHCMYVYISQSVIKLMPQFFLIIK